MVDPRFGRTLYFLVFDTDDQNLEVISNEQNVHAAQGAGIQAAENIAAHRIDVVVAGHFGPKAFRALAAAGIKAASWAEGSVAEAIELVKRDKLNISQAANVEGHWM
jgi:predicted Fe-Mo cluster-binding NifX family protein